MQNILIVEDEENLQILYQQEISELGYNVLTTDSGEEALSILAKEDIDLVVLDIKLKGMNGLEALEDMLLKNRNLKVVINSAFASYKDDFSSWLADAYVIKSSDLGELKTAVAELLA